MKSQCNIDLISFCFAGSLTALVCQHSITPLALPCKLIIPDRGKPSAHCHRLNFKKVVRIETKHYFGLVATHICQSVLICL